METSYDCIRHETKQKRKQEKKKKTSGPGRGEAKRSIDLQTAAYTKEPGSPRTRRQREQISKIRGVEMIDRDQDRVECRKKVTPLTSKVRMIFGEAFHDW